MTALPKENTEEKPRGSILTAEYRLQTEYKSETETLTRLPNHNLVYILLHFFAGKPGIPCLIGGIATAIWSAIHVLLTM